MTPPCPFPWLQLHNGKQAELQVVYPLFEALPGGSTDNAALAAASRDEHAQVPAGAWLLLFSRGARPCHGSQAFSLPVAAGEPNVPPRLPCPTLPLGGSGPASRAGLRAVHAGRARARGRLARPGHRRADAAGGGCRLLLQGAM